MKHIVGMQYIVVVKHELGMPWAHSTHLTMNDAVSALKKAKMEDNNLDLKIETRTLFNVDAMPKVDETVEDKVEAECKT